MWRAFLFLRARAMDAWDAGESVKCFFFGMVGRVARERSRTLPVNVIRFERSFWCPKTENFFFGIFGLTRVRAGLIEGRLIKTQTTNVQYTSRYRLYFYPRTCARATACSTGECHALREVALVLDNRKTSFVGTQRHCCIGGTHELMAGLHKYAIK